MTGERVVAAVHLPTLIVYLTFEKSKGDKESEEPPPEWESLSGLAQISMPEMKSWLQNMTQGLSFGHV